MSRHGTAAPEPGPTGSRTADRGSGARPATEAPWEVAAQVETAPRQLVQARGIAGWPVGRKLAALVAVPLVAILLGSAVILWGSIQQVRDAQQARDLASVIIFANAANSALQRERSATIEFLRATEGEEAAQGKLERVRKETDTNWSTLTKALDDEPPGGWSDEVEIAKDRTADSYERLNSLRTSVTSGRNAESVLSGFAPIFEGVAAVTDALTTELTLQATDAGTSDGAAVLSALTQAAAAAAEERDVLAVALESGSTTYRRYHQAASLDAVQDHRMRLAELRATPDVQSDVRMIQAGNPRLDRFRRDAAQLIDSALRTGDEIDAGSATAFSRAAQERIDMVNRLIDEVATDTRTEAAANERAAYIRAAGTGIGTLLVLLFISLAAALVARTVSEPLRRLRSGAVDVAATQLPAAVRRIEAEGPEADVQLPPVLPPGTKAGLETLDVASAVDGLSATAVKLASNQVRLRRALDEAFVTMSRRSQSMVEKQLAIIDELESTEEDPEQLRNLFRLDHLAARMRRYNDNLLVLAGSAVRTRSSAPVPVAELFRAATSEMEQYERVRLQPVAGATISGQAAGGLVHLLAELLDNAAMYSPPTSPIVLSAAFTPDSGLRIEVQDNGVGIPPAELQRINARLSQPEGVDLSVPSRMGLFVVARLAQRGGFRVWLNQRDGASGTTAEVTVPASLVIGGPGHTGEMPAIKAGPELGGVPSNPAGLPRLGSLNEPRTHETTAAEYSADPDSPLPRRQRTPGSSPGAGVPAAAGTPAAPGSMFTPPGESGQDDHVSSANGLPMIGRPSSAPAPSTPEDGAGPMPLRPRTPGTGTPAPGTPSTGRPAAGTPAAGQPPISGVFPATGELGAVANGLPPNRSTGKAPLAWDQSLPAELAARATAEARERDSSLIGDPGSADDDTATPIFDSISVWFQSAHGSGAAEQAAPSTPSPASGLPVRGAGAPSRAGSGDRAEGDRAAAPGTTRPADRPAERPAARADEPEPTAVPAASRWAALGDQQWLAANARAAAAPTTAGTTETGLPKRRPGANLLPSAASAAPPPPPALSRQSPPVSPPVGLPTRNVGGRGPGAGGRGGFSGREGSFETGGPGTLGNPPANASGGQATGQPPQRPDAEAVRGRLGSYQRGLSSARQARRQALAGDGNNAGNGLFGSKPAAGTDRAGEAAGDLGGEQ